MVANNTFNKILASYISNTQPQIEEKRTYDNLILISAGVLPQMLASASPKAPVIVSLWHV